ncbi:MAG: hypothetical protein ACPG5W_03370, partial [Flavobacteriales bacterium]
MSNRLPLLNSLIKRGHGLLLAVATLLSIVANPSFAQVWTGSSTTSGSSPSLTVNYSSVGSNNITATATTSGSNATFSGPAWGTPGGMTYRLTSGFSGAYSGSNFKCLY